MANVFDYLDWRGDLTLDLVPLCDVDAVVLSRLSYLPLDGLVPPEGATVGALMRQLLTSKPPLLLPEDGRFIPALAASQRFCEMWIMDYVNQIGLESQTQFAAIISNTAHLGVPYWLIIRCFVRTFFHCFQYMVRILRRIHLSI